MNTSDSFDRSVSEWLHADAEHRVPDHLDAVLRRTRTERQRPAWSSLERWLPMQMTLRLSPAPRLAWLVALLVLVLALVAAGLFVASRPRLPAPFGPARNGAIVSSLGGDLVETDPRTQIARPVVAGPSYDFAPYFSRDGLRFMFLRTSGPAADGAPLRVAVAEADGTNVRVVTPPIDHLDWADWSPDGTRIGIITRPSGQAGVLSIVDVAAATVTALDLGVSAQIAYWLPPDGREIVLSATTPGRFSGEPIPALYAVRSDGTGLSKLTDRPASDKDDFQGPVASPDGRLISYTSWNPIGRIHILDLKTGNDVVLPDPTGSTSQAGIAAFSPDGRSVAYPRYVDNTYQLVVAPVDGSTTGVPIGPRLALQADGGPALSYDFTPDGRQVVAMYGREAVTRLLPADGSAGVVLGQGAESFATIQRLAP